MSAIVRSGTKRMQKKLRVAVVTVHHAFNAGAKLQAWALGRVLERMGHAVEFPDWNRIGWAAGFGRFQTSHRGLRAVLSFGYWLCRWLGSLGYAARWRRTFDAFTKNHLPSGGSGRKPTDYDLIVVGSDQVFNPQITGESLDVFLCENTSVRHIAYAASIGDDPKWACAAEARFRAALPRFAAVSVREPLAREILQPWTPAPISLVCDPTLLLSAEDYAPLMRGIAVPREKYLFAYLVAWPLKPYADKVRAIARRMGLRAVIATNYRPSRLGEPRGIRLGVGVAEFLALSAHATCSIVASFHGAVFALKSGRPFVAIGAGARVRNLLEAAGEADRAVPLEADAGEVVALLSRPLLSECDGRLSDAVSRSLAFLRESVSVFQKLSGVK